MRPSFYQTSLNKLVKKILYRLTPRSKTYSMTSSNDVQGLYNFQLYSLHEQSILIYIGVSLSDPGAEFKAEDENGEVWFKFEDGS